MLNNFIASSSNLQKKKMLSNEAAEVRASVETVVHSYALHTR